MDIVEKRVIARLIGIFESRVYSTQFGKHCNLMYILIGYCRKIISYNHYRALTIF